MKRSIGASLAVAAALAVYQVVMAASGSSLPSSSAGAPAKTLTPEERAVEAYNSGIDHKDKGKKAELQIASAKETDKAKLAEKSKGEFDKALKDFKHATELNPNLYQAFNGMGYSYRKLGDYPKALENYDKALQMAPGFPEATEYRGEAYLGLNRVDDAKKAYLELMASDRAQAALLLAAMKDWVSKRKADPSGVDAGAVSSFESWIAERGETAKLTASMGLSGSHHTW